MPEFQAAPYGVRYYSKGDLRNYMKVFCYRGEVKNTGNRWIQYQPCTQVACYPGEVQNISRLSPPVTEKKQQPRSKDNIGNHLKNIKVRIKTVLYLADCCAVSRTLNRSIPCLPQLFQITGYRTLAGLVSTKSPIEPTSAHVKNCGK